MEIVTRRSIVLFTGDGNFRSLIEAIERRGVRVVVVSTISTQPPVVLNAGQSRALSTGDMW